MQQKELIASKYHELQNKRKHKFEHSISSNQQHITQKKKTP